MTKSIFFSWLKSISYKEIVSHRREHIRFGSFSVFKTFVINCMLFFAVRSLKVISVSVNAVLNNQLIFAVSAQSSTRFLKWSFPLCGDSCLVSFPSAAAHVVIWSCRVVFPVVHVDPNVHLRELTQL